MPWGKHAGKDLVDIPLDYLIWLESECSLAAHIQEAVNFEIERRTGDRPGMGKIVRHSAVRTSVVDRVPGPSHIHYPAIVHRTGGISADKLNTCSSCGCSIIPDPADHLLWIAISPEEADRIRKGEN